jgi:D-alanyl-D-alanine carboxypeptidase
MFSKFIKSGALKTTAIATAGFLALSATLIQADTAEAKRRHGAVAVSRSQALKRHQLAARRTRMAPPDDQSRNPLFAAVVVDVKAGKTLYEASADALRHPASITKVMTLYMLFEALEARKLTLDTPLPVSSHASAQAPTKLGLKPGESIRVEDAIEGIVTRSANDAAVVVAEALGGSEDNFAQMMTRKARQLGMSRTSYHNASGLPDPLQITTARDLAVLGIAIQDRFPRYYRYFQTRSFVFRGRDIANHNKLLGNVEGVDGIKTGYTRMSGFNLLTSVKRDGRQVVAVVMGGRSGGSRDATMRRLIENYMPVAYAGGRQSGPLVADAGQKPLASPAQIPDPDPGSRDAVAFVEPRTVEPPKPAPVKPALPKIRPAVVAEVPAARADRPVAAPVRLAAISPLPAPQPAPQPRAAEIAQPAVASTLDSGPILRWVEGAQPVTAPASAPARTADAGTPGETSPVQLVRTTSFKVDTDADANAGAADISPVATAAPRQAGNAPAAEHEPAVNSRSGWIIQIGATDSEEGAKKLLDKARSTGHRSLATAEPFTESVLRNGSTLWRARFAGFNDQRQAQAACAALKSKDFSCMAARL